MIDLGGFCGHESLGMLVLGPKNLFLDRVAGFADRGVGFRTGDSGVTAKKGDERIPAASHSLPAGRASRASMPGLKRGVESNVGRGAAKRSRAEDGGSNASPAFVVVRDELGFEHPRDVSRALRGSTDRCESAWSAFESKASDLGVDLEARSDDVREFVRVKCVTRPSPRDPRTHPPRAIFEAPRDSSD